MFGKLKLSTIVTNFKALTMENLNLSLFINRYNQYQSKKIPAVLVMYFKRENSWYNCKYALWDQLKLVKRRSIIYRKGTKQRHFKNVTSSIQRWGFLVKEKPSGSSPPTSAPTGGTVRTPQMFHILPGKCTPVEFEFSRFSSCFFGSYGSTC